MKKYVLLLCIIVASVFVAKELPLQSVSRSSSLIKEEATSPGLMGVVLINGATFQVTLAQTPEEQARGLGNISSMPANAGMLFIFPTPDKYGFWMKDTLIPLDMIWLDEEKRIVYIEKEVKPESYPKIYTPSAPALYVLEINAGLVDKNNIKPGQILEFVL